ncbi:NADPH-dependent FMN reductase [Thiovulum sp. ES]|nr:NADPH-dependent FMN reductase [Thiovulum sp. ES]
MKNLKVLGVVGSIRSNHKNIKKLERFILDSSTQTELNQRIKDSKIIFSNSDIAVSHSLLASKNYGSNIEIVSITDIFKHKKLGIYYDLMNYNSIDDIDEIDSLTLDESMFQELLKKVDKADGIILGTPVYFGDRSSIANKFLQLTYKYKVLKGKGFGVVSTGAKRNGGQETANIYSLQEALAQEAIVVGNGPKTAQYGGTVWAGDTGKAIDDSFGLETCYGVGRQVAQLSEILNIGEYKSKPKITFVLTMDTEEKKYEKILQKYIKRNLDSYNSKIYNLIDETIYRCIACNVCPSPKMVEKLKSEDFPYHCVIQTKKDNMKHVQEALVNSDSIIFVGVNSHDDLIYRYQAFMERTRFIRHDDFELSNIPSVGMLISELGATNNQIFNVKVLTSFIRHNTFFLKPVEIILKDGEVIYEDSFRNLIPFIEKITSGREKIDPMEISYKATGYSNKTFDETKKLRK